MDNAKEQTRSIGLTFTGLTADQSEALIATFKGETSATARQGLATGKNPPPKAPPKKSPPVADDETDTDGDTTGGETDTDTENYDEGGADEPMTLEAFRKVCSAHAATFEHKATAKHFVKYKVTLSKDVKAGDRQKIADALNAEIKKAKK